MIIKDANADVLIREFDETVRTLLHDSSLVVKRAVDFGTHVVGWIEDPDPSCATSISTLLFRQGLMFSDAIAELLDKGCLAACPPILRAQLEALLGFAYLNTDDSENRANAYRVARVRDELRFAKRALASAASDDKKGGASESDTSDFTVVLPTDKIESQIQLGESLLTSATLAPADTEWKRTKKERGGRAPSWYGLFDGPRNLRELAEDVDMEHHYNNLYGYWSQSTHSTNVMAGIIPSGIGRAAVPKLRFPAKSPQVATICAAMTIESIRRVVEKYTPSRTLDFANWYQKQMRKEFMRIVNTKVVLKDEPDITL